MIVRYISNYLFFGENMKFISTRGKESVLSASEAIVKGLASDGGLFVPSSFPVLKEKIKDLLDMTYPERAATVIGSYLEEYDFNDLLSACEKAYGRFDEDGAAPVVKIDDKTFILELFHGPTLAFKDIALTLLPYLLRKGADHVGIKEQIMILVATSGDTGKAALEGFCNQDGIKINVFYPADGVSDMQKLQMATQEGDNVNVVAVKGNFDDCQNAVKKIFSDTEFAKTLKESGVILSSANSINFGRLVPQIVYYFSAYCDLVNAEEIKLGDKVDFVVPTGNFGNILAGYYAKLMGLPVGKLICASNKNNVLTDFFLSGEYDKRREFYKTTSPSMDILISSNLERLIFEVSGRNGELTASRMEQLKVDGKYSLTALERKLIANTFVAGYADEDKCAETIDDVFEDLGYLSDTHTAVALKVREDNADDNGNNVVVLSTASPYKFPSSVYQAITGKVITDAFVAADKLEELSACPIPNQILSLKQKEVRFTKVISSEQCNDTVLQFAKQK